MKKQILKQNMLTASLKSWFSCETCFDISV